MDFAAFWHPRINALIPENTIWTSHGHFPLTFRVKPHSLPFLLPPTDHPYPSPGVLTTATEPCELSNFPTATCTLINLNSDDLMPNGMSGIQPLYPLKTVDAVIHNDDLKSKPFLNVATCYNCTIYMHNNGYSEKNKVSHWIFKFISGRHHNFLQRCCRQWQHPKLSGGTKECCWSSDINDSSQPVR